MTPFQVRKLRCGEITYLAQGYPVVVASAGSGCGQLWSQCSSLSILLKTMVGIRVASPMLCVIHSQESDQILQD